MALPRPQTCQGSAPTAACKCPAPPGDCTGAGKTCVSGSVITCAVDNNGCIYAGGDDRLRFERAVRHGVPQRQLSVPRQARRLQRGRDLLRSDQQQIRRDLHARRRGLPGPDRHDRLQPALHGRRRLGHLRLVPDAAVGVHERRDALLERQAREVRPRSAAAASPRSASRRARRRPPARGTFLGATCACPAGAGRLCRRSGDLLLGRRHVPDHLRDGQRLSGRHHHRGMHLAAGLRAGNRHLRLPQRGRLSGRRRIILRRRAAATSSPARL